MLNRLFLLVTTLLWSENAIILIAVRLMFCSVSLLVFGVIASKMEKSLFWMISFFLVGLILLIGIFSVFIIGCNYIHFGSTIIQAIFNIIDLVLVAAGLYIWMKIYEDVFI